MPMKPTYLLVPLALAAFAIPAAAQQPQVEACTDTITGNEVMSVAQLRQVENERWPEPADRVEYRLMMLQARVEGYMRRTGRRPERLFDFSEAVAEVPWLSTCDAWRHRVVFLPRGDEYELRSAGPDGVLGTADDVVQNGLFTVKATPAPGR
jgi:hypothetical protein